MTSTKTKIDRWLKENTSGLNKKAPNFRNLLIFSYNDIRELISSIGEEKKEGGMMSRKEIEKLMEECRKKARNYYDRKKHEYVRGNTYFYGQCLVLKKVLGK